MVRIKLAALFILASLRNIVQVVLDLTKFGAVNADLNLFHTVTRINANYC